MEKTNGEQHQGCWRVRKPITFTFRAAFAAILFTMAAGAANSILYVDDDNTSGPWDGSSAHPYRLIQDAVDASGGGIQVVVLPGLYTENVVINNDVQIFSFLSDDPNAPYVTVVDGGQAGSVFRITGSNVLIEGLGITNGLAANGGGLFCNNSHVSVCNSIISGNHTPDGVDGVIGDPGGVGGSSGNGGGVFCLSSELTMTGCEIGGNSTGHGGRGGDGDPYVGGNGGRSGNGGGLYAIYSTVEMNDCIVRQNATGDGGAGGDGDGRAGNGAISGAGGGLCSVDSALVIQNCEFVENTTGWGGNGGEGDIPIGGDSGFGGAVNCEGGSLEIRGCRVDTNATGDGGGAFYYAGGSGGSSGGGAGVCVRNSSIECFSDCQFINNAIGSGGTAAWPGGGGGFTGDGGGACVEVPGSVEIDECVFEGNTMGLGGGGEFGADGGRGGGLYCVSQISVSIRDSHFADNHSGDGSFGWDYGGMGGEGGGAMITVPSATITNCRFVDNTAGDGYLSWGGHGGGLLCTDNATVVNCLLANNSSGGGENADAGGYGGGFLATDATVVNCTICCNTAGKDEGPAGFGGGVSAGGSVSVRSSILYGNSVNGIFDEAAQLHAGAPVVNYSCIQGWTGTWGGMGNISDDPLFAGPGDYHPASEHGRWDASARMWVYDAVTSPCVDGGGPSDAAWKGELWPHGERINMGVYGGTPEASMSPLLRGNPADVTRSGCVGTDDLMLIADKWLGEQMLCPEDINLDGRIDYGDFSAVAQNWAFCVGYDAAGLWEFSENCGVTAYDASTYRNNGLLTNGPVWTPDGALRFGGDDDYVEVPHAASLNFSSAVTVAARVNITNYAANWPKVVVKPHSTYADPWEMFALDLGRYGRSPRFLITDGSAGGQVIAASNDSITLDRNRWYHIAGTYDGAVLTLYVDGQPVASAPASFAVGQNTMPLSIGGRLGTNSFDGLIDNVVIYNRSLSGAEIQALQESGPGP